MQSPRMGKPLSAAWKYALGALLSLGILGAVPAYGAGAADFYKGKTVKLVVGYGPGGGFDTYARMIVPHLEKAMGATVVVENRPGGGGLTALNQLVRDEPDGLTLMLLHGEAAVLAQLVDKPGVRFDLAKVTWLGRVSSEPRVLLVSAKSPYRSLDDLLKASQPVKFAAGGRTDGIGDVAATTCQALGMNCKIITGYKGSKAAALAAIQGEADAITITESSSKNMAEGGKMIAVAALDSERAPLFPNVPTVFEQVKLAPEKAWWINFRADLAKIGRTLVTAPGVPPERVAYLRQVINRALTDPAFVAESIKVKREVRYGDPKAAEKFAREVLASADAKRAKDIKLVLLEKF